jgi:hypothetical protein
MEKVKKNDIVCIRTRRSYTEAITLKTNHYDTFVFAQAVKVNRKGIVEQYILEPNAYPEMVHIFQTVMTISEPMRQAGAKKLFNSLKGRIFTNAELIKGAIMLETEKPTDEEMTKEIDKIVKNLKKIV